MSGYEQNIEENKYIGFDVNYKIISWCLIPPFITSTKLISLATYFDELLLKNRLNY